jgi:hypothetical protein
MEERKDPDEIPEVPKEDPASKKMPEKTGEKKPTANKGLLSAIFTIGVFLIGTIILTMIMGKIEPEKHITFGGILLNHNWQIFIGISFLFWIYGTIRGKDQLTIVNALLWVQLVVLAVLIIFPSFFENIGKKDQDKKIAPPTAYVAPAPVQAVSNDYSDADSSYLGIDRHPFTFADSGRETAEMGLKKEVRGVSFDFNEASNKKIYLIYDDGDTINMERPKHKEGWGKRFKIKSFGLIGKVVVDCH